MAKKALGHPLAPVGVQMDFFNAMQDLVLRRGDPSLAELSSRVHVSRQVLHRAFRGPKLPSRELVGRIVKALTDEGLGEDDRDSELRQMLDYWQLAVSEVRAHEAASRQRNAESGADQASPSRSQTPRSSRTSADHDGSINDSSPTPSRHDRLNSLDSREAFGEILNLQHRLGGAEPVRAVAELVSRELGRATSASSISDWLSGKSVPRQIDVVRAMVTVFHRSSPPVDFRSDGGDSLAELDRKRYITGEIWRMAYFATYQISVHAEAVIGVHDLANPLLNQLRHDVARLFRDKSHDERRIGRHVNQSADPSTWAWHSESDQWAEGLAALRNFVAREGHTQAPRRYVENGIELGRWIAKQRRNRDKLPPIRRAQLERVPTWSWSANSNSWEQHYSVLQKFVEREGHARVPAGQVERGIRLGRWVTQQRALRDSMNAERGSRLESLPGWSWGPQTDRWSDAIASLQTFVERQGHSKVPYTYIQDGFKLGHWVANQRRARHTMSDKRRASLEALPGWSWSVSNDSWDMNFSALQAFASRTGHTNVPIAHIEGGVRLGNWVARMRRVRNQLSDERRRRLENVPGWKWRAP